MKFCFEKSSILTTLMKIFLKFASTKTTLIIRNKITHIINSLKSQNITINTIPKETRLITIRNRKKDGEKLI